MAVCSPFQVVMLQGAGRSDSQMYTQNAASGLNISQLYAPQDTAAKSSLEFVQRDVVIIPHKNRLYKNAYQVTNLNSLSGTDIYTLVTYSLCSNGWVYHYSDNKLKLLDVDTSYKLVNK